VIGMNLAPFSPRAGVIGVNLAPFSPGAGVIDVMVTSLALEHDVWSISIRERVTC
jgi:hypothetical protein